MQENPIALSPHVQRLIDEKYSVVIDGDYLIVVDVPYISEPGVISRGSIISSYQYINGTEILGDHTVWFTGSVPFSASGKPLNDVLVANATKATVANREVQCHFSYKSDNKDTLENIYNKVMHYIRKLHSYTSVLNPCVNASGEGKVSVKQKKSVFHYPNTSISKSGLDAYDEKLKLGKIAIIGLGGTGSYLLDLIAKTPVNVIALYDDDFIEPSTVFRMPGALTIEEAFSKIKKTDYLCEVYSRMRVGVESYPVRISDANVAELDNCNFVFISIDHGPSRGLIAKYLLSKGIPFIDVGIGVEKLSEEIKLFGRVRVHSINANTSSFVDKLPTADDKEDAVYNNIQVAELNALNAMLAIFLSKQILGFYVGDPNVALLRYTIAENWLSKYFEKTE